MKLVKQRRKIQTTHGLVCNCPFASQSAMFGGGWYLVNSTL